MPRFLCIYLAAPLASFGEAAGNAQRATADRPTRSALLGLAGAAMGIDREDTDAQAALAASFSVSTRTIRAGTLLTDFHTFEGVSRSKNFYSTRAKALSSGGNLNTSITRREYRSDGLWQAAFHEKAGATLTLDSLHRAFLNPHYALWLGRKSCPLSHPLAPVFVEAEDLRQAFGLAHAGGPAGGVIATQDRSLLAAGNRTVSRHRRLDEPLDRSAWTFASRDEFVLSQSGDDTR